MVKLPKKFSVGEKIFAKVRGYPAWPAKIEKITDVNPKIAKYHVTFFGTNEVGTCRHEDLFKYAENKEKYTKAAKRKIFITGIQQLEEELKKYPNPSSNDSLKDSEGTENVPENVDDPSEKEGETILSSVDGEGDNESGNLVIDEGDKKKAIKRKAPSVQNTPDVPEVKKKRGRKSMATILAENAALKQEAAHDSQDEDAEKKVVSRSGRKIKPKRFHDFSDAEIPTDPTKNDQSVRSRIKSKTEEANENQETPIAPIKKRMSVESKISSTEEDAAVSDSVVDAGGASPGYSGRLLVAHTSAGVPVGIKLDVDRPDRFESEAARARWDLSVARNAMRLKEQLESGDIATELIKDSLDFNVHVPEDDKKSQIKDEAEAQNQNTLRILRIESQILFLDTQIRSSLGLDQANADECLEAMNQLLELQITPFMLKKYSPIVETIKRLRRYVGNLPDWKLSEEETTIFKEKADKIKRKAELIYNKFKTLFTIPEGRTFWETFTEQVDVYKQYIKDMTPEEVYALLTDPTEPANSAVESSTDLANPIKSDMPAESTADKNIAAAELEAAE